MEHLGEPRLTLDLCLVHDEVTGSPAALELLRAALLGTELLILPLVKGEPRGGEPAVAGGACKGRQWVLLERDTGRKEVAKPWDGPGSRRRGGLVFPTSPFPNLRVPKLHSEVLAPLACLCAVHSLQLYYFF